MLSRLRLWSTRLGFVGLVVLALAFASTAVAYASGVHCIGCDRGHLSVAQLAFWEPYFTAKDALYVIATVALLLAIPLATRRLPFITGFLFAAAGMAVTPL